jgi:rhodanese-related sulfurtransferase/predicted methyltransferase
MLRHRSLILPAALLSAVVFGQTLTAQAPRDDSRISAADLAALLDRYAVIVLDVRDEGMFARGHLPGARLVPPDKWTDAAAALSTATLPIVTYCSCPAEETSLRAAARFEQLGVRNVRALTGGYDGWAAAGRPVVAPQPRSAAPASSYDGGRESWQRVPDVFAAMGVRAGAVVADIGAGDGFFTQRLAQAVAPGGRVYAVDISQGALDRLKTRVSAQGLTNIDAVLGATNDPRLPEGSLDAALIVNAYHEMREHQAMLTAIRRALKPGGRLVILESVRENLKGAARETQEQEHQLASHFLQQDAIAAGFEVARLDENFTRRGGGGHAEYMIVLTPVR